MLYARSAARLLAAAVTFCLTVALSIGLTVGLSFAQETDPPPDSTPDTTTPTTPPDTTPPDTTPPDTSPTTTTPDSTTTTTTPDSTTTTTTPDSTTTTTTPDSTTTTMPDAATEWPSIEPDSAAEPGGGTRDRDIYVGTISTLSRAQRAALDEFLAATARLTQAIAARAGIAEATTPDPNTQPISPYFAPIWPGQETQTTSKHARSSATRIRLRTEQRAPRPPYVDQAKTAEEAAARAAAAQAAVDAAQADLDRATDALRAVANGDALITALLTGKPPPGDTLAQRIAAAQVGQGNPLSLTALWQVPIENARAVSPYGFRLDPFTGDVGFHPGVDISATQGTPIRAVAAGTVLVAGSQGGYGNAVVLDHGDSLATLYGHMLSMAVAPGQHVEAGEVIGYVGSTGRSTGPHLHFEVRIHGVTVDPLPTFTS